jgi:isoleucyl-tRNA synthetase
VIGAAGEDYDVLASLGDDLRFVLITSAATVTRADALAIDVTPSGKAKCERCWHYRSDVGADATHPTLCGRCLANLFGSGERRAIA